MQSLEDILRRAEEVRQEVRIGANTAQKVGLVLVQLVDVAQTLLKAIQDEEAARKSADTTLTTNLKAVRTEVEDLPSPVSPLTDVNGVLELKYGNSLYVKDGMLCVKGVDEESGVVAPAYSQGKGILITANNVIEVSGDFTGIERVKFQKGTINWEDISNVY